ncbi:DNA-binding cell septation regulator SpoVG [Lachnospiraceae bacterium PF1-21]
MDYKVKMTSIGVGNLIAKGEVVINDCIRIANVRLMKYMKDGEERAFLSFPQKKTIKDGKVAYQDVINIAKPADRETLLALAQEAVKMDLLTSLDEKVVVKSMTMRPPGSTLKALATVTLGDAIDINGLQIYEKENGEPYVAMPRIQGNQTWEEFISFNNNFTYKGISSVVLKSYEEHTLVNDKTIPDREAMRMDKIKELANRIVEAQSSQDMDTELRGALLESTMKKLEKDPGALLKQYEAEQNRVLEILQNSKEYNATNSEIDKLSKAYQSMKEISSDLKEIVSKKREPIKR